MERVLRFTLLLYLLGIFGKTTSIEDLQNEIESEYISKDSSDETSQQQQRLSSSAGNVASPFYFFCHTLKQGEPADVGLEDVKLSLNVSGERQLENGYEPQGVYHLSVTSNVKMDGFLLTGVQKVTKKLLDSNLPNLPPSPSNTNSAGNVCAFLHSHISKRPRSNIGLMWMAPPAGSGCVAFLATGSLKEKILFKDLLIKEICEKNIGKSELKKQAVLALRNEGEFIFKEDFEGQIDQNNIWEKLKNGSVDEMPVYLDPGNAAVFEGASSISTFPLDFTDAKHFQFTLSLGNCTRKGKIRVSIGSVRPLGIPQNKLSSLVNSPTSSSELRVSEVMSSSHEFKSYTPSDQISTELSAIEFLDQEFSSLLTSDSITDMDFSVDKAPHQSNREDTRSTLLPEAQVDNTSSFISTLVHSVKVEESENAGVENLTMSDEGTSITCTYWRELDSQDIQELPEVHTRAVPRLYQTKDVCLKWELDDTEESILNSGVANSKTDLPCWILDNVAVTTRHATKGPLIDDFDPIDATNWLFFPGGEVREACGSEGNSLYFDGSTELNWLSTRQIDLSWTEDKEEILYRKTFTSESDDEGWLLTGSSTKACPEDENSATFYLNDTRRICSPYIAGKNYGVVRVIGGMSRCSQEESVNINVIAVFEGLQEIFETVRFQRVDDVIVIPMTSKLQRDGARLCLEQLSRREGERAWTIKEITFLPWIPSEPKHFLQAQINLNCGYKEAKVDIEGSTDGGESWRSLHGRCLPGNCEGNSSFITPFSVNALHSGWSLITIPLPYVALTSTTRIRIRQVIDESSAWRPLWALDYIFVGRCPEGCNSHGLCTSGGKCKCRYGYKGVACEIPDVSNPVYIQEPFFDDLENSVNILEASGGEVSYQCGVIGVGTAAVFKGRGIRFLTTIDVDTTQAQLLEFNFRSGTPSDVGKCPGPDSSNEGIFIHYSCTGGTSWNLLHTIKPWEHKEPSHVSLWLPPGARGLSCRFQIWQAQHSGSGRDMWALDDLTITSQKVNTIQLGFDDNLSVNNSLRFHLGKNGPMCGRSDTLVFSEQSDSSLVRFLETKSVRIGPSYMMQFDLVIGCDTTSFSTDKESTVVVEYSLNHGLTWKLVQRPCAPSQRGCKSYFTRGTVYHVSEFSKWRRVTIRLPEHTWSPTTRLRFRQVETSDVGLTWAVDNVYIGHQCEGLCSGHGYCTTRGCRCDEHFHGYKCLPLHKLHDEISTSFDNESDIDLYGMHVIGGSLVTQYEGCGVIVSGNNLYFGSSGIRHFETDDTRANELESISFYLVIGGEHGLQRACQSSENSNINSEYEEHVNEGSVVLEYSVDSGISWDLMKEMIHTEHRISKQVYLPIEKAILTKAKKNSDVIRFRLWQPKHEEKDQWAIDDFIVKRKQEMSTIQASFRDDVATQNPWQQSSASSNKIYCHSTDFAHVMDSRDPLRTAVTGVLTLNETDVISFQISVGCSEDPDTDYPVHLEYTRDGGNSWKLVQEGCRPSTLGCGEFSHPSSYWPGRHGPWQRILIPLDHRFIHGDVQFRFAQQNPSETSDGEFALKDLYIGPPCKYNCMGHGSCNGLGFCRCDKNYFGKYCGKRSEPNSAWLKEDFEDENLSPQFWASSRGKLSSAGCDPDHIGKVMFFSDEEQREIVTKELDTKNVQYLVFELQIGANDYESRCQPGISPRDDVLVEYSTDNALSWKLLQRINPQQTTHRNQSFFLPLPRDARTRQTKFKWYQIPQSSLAPHEGMQSEWHLDDVMVLANRTLPKNLKDDFSSTSDDVWFVIRGGEPTEKCSRMLDDNVLFFSGHIASRYAETWDIEVNEGTIVQFDIMPQCINSKTATSIAVEFSTNYGKSWELFKPTCNIGECNLYDTPSIYSSTEISNWTRISLTFPPHAVGDKTRVRFQQIRGDSKAVDPFSEWAIDNLFIGDSCPWSCSGHGYCELNKCRCDKGFFGDFCVPNEVLPCELLDKFNSEKPTSEMWNSVQGAEVSTKCGAIVSESALIFFKEGLRFAITTDLDMTSGHFLQFTLQMGCRGSASSHPSHRGSKFIEATKSNSRKHILVQYSINGGITWKELKRIQYHLQDNPVFVSILLNDFPYSKHNATRFRLWQTPDYHQSMEDIWAIDNLYIGGEPISPNVLYDDFETEKPAGDAWIDWPGGNIQPMCNSLDSSLTFGTDEGENAVYTKDLTVNHDSVLQFDIKVGCGNLTKRDNNISLQYSNDFGVSWKYLRPIKAFYSESRDFAISLQTPSFYYPNAAQDWFRYIIPLSDMPFCGNIRFRWWQGYYHSKESSEPWALDNIYIGPSCINHCMGHGYCLNGRNCSCDVNYEAGIDCQSSKEKDQNINEDFEGNDMSLNFVKWSGGQLSNQCNVLTGQSFFLFQQGERMLITKDLDLSHGSVIQFYVRFSCSDYSLLDAFAKDHRETILLQYSFDGGISWSLIKALSRSENNDDQLLDTNYYVIPLPDESKTNSTRLRWWQPSLTGEFKSQWAIDEIYVGSAALSLPHFFEAGNGSAMLLSPGAQVDRPCGIQRDGLHFIKHSSVRFAVTPDILINTNTFIQFEMSIGCQETNHCYDIKLEYSIDYGKSWHLIRENCLPSNPDCSEYFESTIMTSDLYSSTTFVTLNLPLRTRWKLARFRFIQVPPFDVQHTWWLSRVYVGNDCPNKCSGRGVCNTTGHCTCQDGWEGNECEKSTTSLPSYAADDFENSLNLDEKWRKIVGAKVSEICGPVGSKSALHFYGGCTRLLETSDLDLQESFFVQFDFQTGCLHSSMSTTLKESSSVLVQISCNAGITWKTLRILKMNYEQSIYVWIEIPKRYRCFGGRVRWWQPGKGPRSNLFDWAIDDVIVGGRSAPFDKLSLSSSNNLNFPMFLKFHNYVPGQYCDFITSVPVFASTPSEPAIIQTTDLEITSSHSIHFRLALGCGAVWDNSIEPVSLQYSSDFGKTWNLVREMCLPFNSTSCTEYQDESIFFAPQEWQYYVFPLANFPPNRYVRFRWIQNETADVMGNHKWALTDVYIGPSCTDHCLGRGACVNGTCFCNKEYDGKYCQNIVLPNVPYIRDTFKNDKFLSHWQHVQGAVIGKGCDEELEEPPAVTFQGPHTRTIVSKPVDARASRFVLFTAQIGSLQGRGICRKPDKRIHNVYLQYSTDGGIRWSIIREIDHKSYLQPLDDYILIPQEARTPSTIFRFWQPRITPTPPAWSLDNVFIGGSEIGAAQLLESFDGEPTISEWLFAPHSEMRNDYCGQADNGSLVWEADQPGHRYITTQELLVQQGHILQFKISVGCQQTSDTCSPGPSVKLEYTKDGGASGWDLVRDNCLPETSPDPDCYPYVFHGPSIYSSDVHSSWKRITLLLPEKTWSSTTQFRWVQDAGSNGHHIERILPWALDDVYIGPPCVENCRGRGNCVKGVCHCDTGFAGKACDAKHSKRKSFPVSFIEGFEGGLLTNWATVSGGGIGLGCNSLAPYGHGKHLYFNGCGTRHAITYDLDLRGASKIMFVLRIGSHDGTRTCKLDLSDPKRAGNKCVIFQFSIDNQITWTTIDVHSPLDFRKARRVAYSLPRSARQYGVQLRWWQPEHDGQGTDQWAIDNIEVILAQRFPNRTPQIS